MCFMYSPAKTKEKPTSQFYVKSFEGDITWSNTRRSHIYDVTWVNWGHDLSARAFGSDDVAAEWSFLHHLCIESGKCIRTLVNGDRWEGNLIKYFEGWNGNERGTWTCTDKDGFVTEIAGTDGRNTRHSQWSTS